MFTVKYLIRSSGVVVTKVYDSPYLASQLVRKLKRSKKCELLEYPVFG